MSNQAQSGRNPNSGNQPSRQPGSPVEQGTELPRGSSEAQEKLQRVAKQVAGASQNAASHFVGEPAQDLLGLAKQYVKDKPDIAAMWCFAFGVMVGWKLRG